MKVNMKVLEKNNKFKKVSKIIIFNKFYRRLVK
jgi:hypothetical protein